MAYHVEVLPACLRELKRLDRPTRQRIGDAIDALAEHPRPDGCKKLVGEANVWRVRVGDWRILYEVHDRRLIVLIVLVVRVAHRKDVYRD